MEADDKQDSKVVQAKKGEGDLKMVTSQAARPFAEMEKFFERFMGQGWPFPMGWQRPWWNELFDATGMRMPSMDVIDREKEVFIRAELPGVEKKGLDISLVGQTLNIRGEIHQEEKNEKGDFHWREITNSTYTRSVALPAAVDASKVSAVLKNGILEITLPKLETDKRHTIAIQEGK